MNPTCIFAYVSFIPHHYLQGAQFFFKVEIDAKLKNLDTAELGYSYNAYSRNRTVVNILFIPFLHVVISLLFSPVCSQHGCSQLSM